MLGLAPVALATVGLQFALFVNALALLGIDAAPAAEGQPSPAKSVGAAASLAGGITLIFASMWFLIGAPLGREGAAVPVQLTFSAITGMYGLLWLGLAIVQMMGWDARPVGNTALISAVIQVIEMIIIAGWGLTLHLTLVEIVLLSYVVVLVGFWAVTHGRLAPRIQGYLLLIGVVTTFYLMFWASGILLPPG